MSPRPIAENVAPTTSSFGRCSAAGAGTIRLRKRRMKTTTTVSPAKTQRQLKYVVT